MCNVCKRFVSELEGRRMKAKIELDEEVVSFLLKEFGVDSKEDLDKGLKQKVEETVNGLLKSWIKVQHTKDEREKL